MIPDILKELTVEAGQAIAFDVFTRKIDLWWPKSHHVGKTPMVETILEPGVGGRWYTIHEDKSEVMVGYVQTWEPPRKLVLIWQIDANFVCNPDVVSEIEVEFVAEGLGRTRVLFAHRNLDRLGDGTKVIESMDQGWGKILALYAALCAKP